MTQPPTPWRPVLARALHRNRSLPNARYLQLATLTLDQRPANRTIVFRGFLEHTNQLKFVTDQRSAKVEQVHNCHWAEACWYFPKTREQFRISGQLLLIDQHCVDQDLQRQRHITWKTLSDAAQAQFSWPEPGIPLEEDSPPITDVTAGDMPLSSFCILLLKPDRVDHLELRGTPQQRCLYQLESDQWSVQAVNP